MPPANSRSVSQQLRDAIGDCGLSVRELGRRAEVDPGQIHRFLGATRGLTTETVDRLAAELGLRLVEQRSAPRRHAK